MKIFYHYFKFALLLFVASVYFEYYMFQVYPNTVEEFFIPPFKNYNIKGMFWQYAITIHIYLYTFSTLWEGLQENIDRTNNEAGKEKNKNATIRYINSFANQYIFFSLFIPFIMLIASWMGWLIVEMLTWLVFGNFKNFSACLIFEACNFVSEFKGAEKIGNYLLNNQIIYLITFACLLQIALWHLHNTLRNKPKNWIEFFRRLNK